VHIQHRLRALSAAAVLLRAKFLELATMVHVSEEEASSVFEGSGLIEEDADSPLAPDVEPWK
jgi:hypothetical protein